MNCSHRIRRSSCASYRSMQSFQFLAVLFTFSFSNCFADLPSQLQTSINKAKEDLESKYTTAKQNLLSRFDKKIAQVRTAPKLNAEERQNLIGTIEAQKANFEKLEIIPFSPAMREEVIVYLNTVQKAEVSLSKAYDKGIEFHTKQSSDDEARILLAEKRTALAPKVVGVWELNFVGDNSRNWTQTLHSDGTTRAGTWTLDRQQIVIRTPNKEAPGGAWVLKCNVSPDGMRLDITNQLGHKLEGKLLNAQDPKVGFIDRAYEDPAGKEFKYVLFVPYTYNGETAFPLIVYLHGSGAVGDDGKKPSMLSLGANIRKSEKEFPFFALFPQARQTWDAESDDANRALAMLDDVQKEFEIDARRVALTGQSLGGYGTWSIAAAHPDRWAAIVPVCGGGDTTSANALKDIPCWCFHGADDQIVKVENSRKMIAAIKEAGGAPKYTEYPGVGHNSYENAYATRELYQWLLLQKRK